MIVARTLPPRKTLNGKFDAYCHVCWRAVYALWIDDVDPSGMCPHGALKIVDCAEAMEWAKIVGEVAKLKAMTPDEQAAAEARWRNSGVREGGADG